MKGRVLFLLVGFIVWLWPPLIFANQTDTYLAKPVTLHYKRTPLRQVLTDLSKKTHVSFVYQDLLVDSVHVSCRLNNKPLESVLPGIIDKEKIDYRIISHSSHPHLKRYSPEQGNGQLIREPGPATLCEHVDGFSTVRTREGGHVLHYAQYWHLHLLEHLGASQGLTLDPMGVVFSLKALTMFTALPALFFLPK